MNDTKSYEILIKAEREIKKLREEVESYKNFIRYILGMRAIGYEVKAQIKEKYNKLFNEG